MLKNLVKFIGKELKYFFTNPLWRSTPLVFMVILSVAINVLIWYLYLKNGRDTMSIVSIGYSSGVVVLNLFLANLVYDREEIVSLMLISVMLLVQIIFLIFLKVFALP